MNEMRRCLASEGTHDHRAILTAVLQELHPEWEVAPISELVSYFLDEMSDHWEGPVSINVPLVRWNKTGFVAQLDVEKRHSGVNAFYRDPFTAAFLQYNEGFKEALESAWSYVKTEFDVDGCEVRWRLRGVNQYEEEKNIPNLVTGSSVGAGAAVALAALFTNDRKFVGSKWAITGTVTDEGLIGTVNGHGSNLNDNYREKLHAVASKHLKLIVPGEDWQHVKDDPSSGSISVLKGATTVREATDTIISEERAEKRRVFFKRGFIAAAAAALILAVFASVAAAYAWQQKGIAVENGVRLAAAKRELEKKNVELGDANADLSNKNVQLDAARQQLQRQNAILGKTNISLGEQKEVAESQRQAADIARNNEQKQRVKAEEQRQLAEVARNEAQEQRKKAEQLEREASAQRQLAVARQTELQADRAMMENDPASAQLLYAKALSLDERLDTKGRYLQSRARRFMKPSWSNSIGYVSSPIRFSPDGQVIALGKEDSSIALLNASTGQALGQLVNEDANQITSVAFSADGQHLATASPNGIVTIWDYKSGKQIRVIRFRECKAKGAPSPEPSPGKKNDDDETEDDGCAGNVLMTFNKQGSQLAIGTINDPRISVWNVQNGALVTALAYPDLYLTSLAFTGDGKIVASCMTGDVWILETGSSKTALQLKHNGRLLSAKVSSTGLLATAGDNLIRIWNLTDNKQIYNYPLRHNLVNSIDFMSDGRFIISGASDGTMKLWEVSSGKEILSFDSGLKALDSIAITSNDRVVAKSSEGTYQLIKSWTLEQGAAAIALGRPQGITADVVFSPDGTKIASLVAPDDSPFATIHIWDAPSRQLLNKIPLDKLMGIRGAVGNEDGDSYLPPLSIQFAGHGKFILLGGLGPKPVVFNAQTGSQIAPFTSGGKDQPHIFTAIAASPDEVTFAAADDDGDIHIYDVATGLEQAQLKGHDEPITYLKFSSDGTTLASSSLDQTVRLWNVRDKKVLKTFSNTFPFLSVDVSRDGKMIAATSMDQKLHVWNLLSEKEVLNHEAFDPQVTSISFSPDGRWLAWCSFSTSDVHLLRIDSGEEVPPLHNTRGPLMRVSFSPDGRWLAASGSESEINLWSMIEIEKAYDSPAADLLKIAESDTGLTIDNNDRNSFAGTKMPILSRSELYSLAGSLTESTFSIIPLETQRNQATENCRPVPIVATLNPFPISFLNPGPACHNFPMLDARIVEPGHYSQNEVIRGLGRTASKDDTIRVRIYVDNGAGNNEPPAQAIARNVRITTAVDAKVGSEHILSASLAATNTNTVFQTFPIHTEPNTILEIVPNSGQIRDWQNVLLKDHVQLGGNTFPLGDIAPGFETDLFLYFDVRVVAGKETKVTESSERRRPSGGEESSITPSRNKGGTKQCPNPPQTATLNPFRLSFSDPGEVCTNYAPLDLSIGGKYSSSESEWKSPRTVKAGDQFYAEIYIDNGAANNLPLAQTLARNIKVSTTVDTSMGTEHLITVSFSGDNTNAVSHTMIVKTAPNEFLEVVPNSGELFDAYNHLIQNNLLVGNRITGLGNLAPGFETDLFLRFSIRVRSAENGPGSRGSNDASSITTSAALKGQIAQCPNPSRSATFNPFRISFENPLVPCTNFPAISLKLANGNWPKDEQEWNQEFQAATDNEIVARVYLDNGSANNLPAAQAVAKNVKITTTVDTDASAEHILTVSFTSDNAAAFSKSIRIRTAPEDYLDVIANSGELYNSRAELLRKNLQIGNNVFEIGDLAPGFETDIFLLFKLRIRKSNTVSGDRISVDEGSRMTRILTKGLSTNCANPPVTATLNPFPLTFASPPETCRNYPALDLQIGKFSQNETELNAERLAKPGDEILAEIYIDNGAADNLPRSETVARNVKVITTVDESAGSTHSVSVSFAGDNTNTVSKTIVLRTPSKTRLNIVPNSGQLFDFQNRLLKNNIQLGNNTYSVGDIGPGFAEDLFLLFKIRVESIETMSSRDGAQEESRISTGRKMNGVSCSTPPSVATLNPYPITFASPAEYCKNYEPIDMRHATETGQYSKSEQDWKDGIDAQPGDELYALIYIDNGAADNLPLRLTTAKNVKVTSKVDGEPGSLHFVSVSFSGENTNTVSGAFSVHTPQDCILEVVPNTGQIRNFTADKILRDHFQIGNNTIDVGDIAPGFSTDLFIRFKVRVARAVKNGTAKTPDPESATVTLSPNKGLIKNCPNPPASATLNPFPISFNDDQRAACSNYPPLDLRIVDGGKYSQNEDDWHDGLDAKPGDEVYALMYVDNGASDNGPLSQTIAKHVQVKSAVDTSVGREHFVSVSFAGDNTNTISKTLIIRTEPNDYLDLVPNSGEIFSNDFKLLQKDLQIGNNVFPLGDLKPGFDQDLFVRFKLQVKRSLDAKSPTRMNHSSNRPSSVLAMLEGCPNPISVPVLNPFPLTFKVPGERCKNYPPLDLRLVNGGNYSTNINEWLRGRSAREGDELFALIYISNGAANYGLPPAQTLARNVKLTTFVDSNTASVHYVSVFFGGDNTNVVAKTLPITTNSDDFLEIVPNSGEVFGYQGSPRLKSDIQLGNNTYLVGDISPGFETDLFVRFRIRVRRATK